QPVHRGDPPGPRQRDPGGGPSRGRHGAHPRVLARARRHPWWPAGLVGGRALVLGDLRSWVGLTDALDPSRSVMRRLLPRIAAVVVGAGAVMALATAALAVPTSWLGEV